MRSYREYTKHIWTYRSYHSKNLIVEQCAKNDADVGAIWVTVKKNTKIMILLCWYVFIEVYVLITKISAILVMVAIQDEIKSIIHYSLCSIFSFHNSSILQKKIIHHFQKKITVSFWWSIIVSWDFYCDLVSTKTLFYILSIHAIFNRLVVSLELSLPF